MPEEQLLQLIKADAAQGIEIAIEPVSYTHLDVYKRQAGSSAEIYRYKGF